ncbi:hypothetical protein BRD01_04880 [Halobacteriales archaeon QS_8_65_32]|nr:MAG: hypothetical protein BRD01_04880 [Halobacteriales archaeon QS_8_65_32]
MTSALTSRTATSAYPVEVLERPLAIACSAPRSNRTRSIADGRGCSCDACTRRVDGSKVETPERFGLPPTGQYDGIGSDEGDRFRIETGRDESSRSGVESIGVESGRYRVGVMAS